MYILLKPNLIPVRPLRKRDRMLCRKRETLDDLRARLNEAEERVLTVTAQGRLETGNTPEGTREYARPAPWCGLGSRLAGWITAAGSPQGQLEAAPERPRHFLP